MASRKGLNPNKFVKTIKKQKAKVWNQNNKP